MNTITLPDAAQIAALTKRLHTACLTVSVLRNDGPVGYFSAWPAYRHDHWDWGNELNQRTEGDIVRRFLAPARFAATPRQIDDCLPALRLLDGVERDQRFVVVLRAFQQWNDWHGGWQAIGDVLKISDRWAAKLHHHAMLYAFQRQHRLENA